MKIGLITNLLNSEKYVSEHLGFTDSKKLLSATGGNTGNVAFVHSVQSLLANDYGVVHWGDNAEAVNKHYDMLVICCANQIGSHVDLGVWAKKLLEFNLPVVLIGLGAQSDKIGVMPEVPEGTIRFLNVVKELRKSNEQSNIITRGEFSSWVLAELGFESSPLGCPSLLTSSDAQLGQTCFRNQSLKGHKRIMVPGGNPWHKSSIIENKLIELVNNYHGEYILQHPDIIFKLLLDDNSDLTQKQIEVLENTYSSIGELNDIRSWLIAHSVFFAEAQNWLNYSRKFSSAIGPRYHGIALPIQVGVPGKVIAIDSRTEELAKTTGIPVVAYTNVSTMTVDELAEASLWSKEEADHFDSVRKSNSLEYTKFFEVNGLQINDYVKVIANY
ncbi:polysaccharide pyruvyl transferase family protein [Vibrio alfacsensis]|uniref:polysaccharide pyruvyl transferase family protein n=1 Tax=Vibrio alfacsensis TaxID=1074311 RepID=UPI0040697CA1